MLIKFFSNGKGAGAGPVDYLVAREVLAYDSNRDLIRDADGQPLTVTREPLPEVLRGNPERTKALIDASRHKWTYRAGVISFAREDAPSEAQRVEIMDAFERLAFAGLDPEQYDMLWVRHSHEDRVELHFCTPRLELTTGNSLNIAPPGYQRVYDSLRDLMNQRHGWADPMELQRAQEVRNTIETPTRAQGREELHAWILDQVSIGLITDRSSMVEALSEAGFDLPRAGKAYLTAKDPETGERWRLKGEIFHEDWQAEHTAQREAERGAGYDPTGTRRLDGIPTEELQERFDQHCAARAEYNRNRYPSLSEDEQELLRDENATDQALDVDLTLADDGAGTDGDRLDDGSELVLDLDADEFRADADGADADRSERSDLAGDESRQDSVEELHAGERADAVHRDQGEIDDNAPDSLGARLARLRRAVGDGLRNLSRGIERVRGTLDRQDRDTTGWLGRLRDLAHSFAGRINDGLKGLVERRGELQRAGRSTAEELDASEGRRREAETELNELQLERDHRHDLGL
ncbi:relaxase family protein [Roseovarius aestuarii]|uniref:relaxase/mobilization nuclease domain-containing protein n=1 Tax=Roseovarius aestuarii TaxID=475083 RepID=UPI000A270B9A|nr:relaxase/mobilization nuclease domain-containing protein [Roseovarius aestuarii]